MANDPNEIEYYRGDFYPKVMTIKDKATKIPVDLTGATLVMTVNTEKDPVDTTNELFKISGVIDADPTTGKVSFTPTAENTDQPKAKYWYDISMETAGVSARTIVKAPFVISMDIGK